MSGHLPSSGFSFNSSSHLHNHQPTNRSSTPQFLYSIPNPSSILSNPTITHHPSRPTSYLSPKNTTTAYYPHSLARPSLRPPPPRRPDESRQHHHHHHHRHSLSAQTPLDASHLADDEAETDLEAERENRPIRPAHRRARQPTDSPRSASPTSADDAGAGALSGEVDERDRSNPLVLHNARRQLASPAKAVARPIALEPSSVPLLVRLGHHRRDSTRAGSSMRASHLSSALADDLQPPTAHHHHPSSRAEEIDPLSKEFEELRLQRRRSAALLALPPHPRTGQPRPSLIRTGPAAATMSLESAQAVISPTTADVKPRPVRDWISGASERRHSLAVLPADGIPVHGARYAPRELSATVGKAGALLERVISREPVRLRDVVSRITFTFDEHHRCAWACRRAMVIIGRSQSTLPSGSMDPVRIGQMTVQPPRPVIYHEPCGPLRAPQVDVEWTDGTWQAFEPLNMNDHEILRRCHFDAERD